MPLDRRCTLADQRRRARTAVVADGHPRRARALPQRQRPGDDRKVVRDWVVQAGVTTLYIEPGSPWENGYVQSLNRNLLDGKIFRTLQEATVLIEQLRRYENTVRPHSSLGYRQPAQESMGVQTPGAAAWPSSAALRSSGQRGKKHALL